MKNYTKMIKNEKHFTSVLNGFSEAFVTGKFCDVKVVCKDTNLWAHRLVLGSVSPFLRVLLADFERRGDDVITIFLPLIKGYHMKLVLDYIYSGAMYLCGAHMQYVIQVMEVLQLKCGVSVNKMVKATEESLDPEKQWIEIEHSTMHLKEYDSDPDTHKDDLEADMRMTHMAQNGDLKGLDSATINKATVNENSQANANMLVPTPSKGLDASVQSEVKMPIPQRPIEGDEESDDDNDVVMVELDEDFVVERVEQQSSQEGNMAEVVGEMTAPSHRCALCGRTFNHYDNLQVHLTGHLGVVVKLNRCNACQKNFKNKNELDLHMRSHKFAKMLGKYKINKSKHTSSVIKKKIISTVGSKDKKIVRKYVKKSSREQPVLTRIVEKAVRAPKRPDSSLTCAICDKSFGVRSIYVRHIKKFHPDLATTMLQTLPSVKVKKCQLTNITLPAVTLTNGSAKPKRTPVSPKKFKDSFERYENPTVATPTRFASPSYDRSHSSPARVGAGRPTLKLKAARTPKTPKTPKTVDYYSTLECPDCCKVFVAKSIFDRHLQSARHGHFKLGPGSPGSDGPLWPASLPAPPCLPASPATPSPGPSKIECHLCGQTFVRVKDLAKHREKVCSAYHNMVRQQQQQQ